VASARVSRRTWFEADPECSGTETKKMMVENARGNEEVCDAHKALEKIDPLH
jgi:hypothetical protein